eukprot:62276-Lingulodinium_polyedra.AAC.1
MQASQVRLQSNIINFKVLPPDVQMEFAAEFAILETRMLALAHILSNDAESLTSYLQQFRNKGDEASTEVESTTGASASADAKSMGKAPPCQSWESLDII